MFVAININKELKDYIFSISNTISVNAVKNSIKIKNVDIDNLHISIKFLGNLNSLEIEKTIRALQNISSKKNSFNIELAKEIGFFPNNKYPKIIWIGIKDGYEEIKIIYDDFNRELKLEPFFKSEKSIIPHITLSRIKNATYIKNTNILFENIPFKVYKQNVSSIDLMESVLTPKGPIYNCISNFPFLKNI